MPKPSPLAQPYPQQCRDLGCPHQGQQTPACSFSQARRSSSIWLNCSSTAPLPAPWGKCPSVAQHFWPIVCVQESQKCAVTNRSQLPPFGFFSPISAPSNPRHFTSPSFSISWCRARRWGLRREEQKREQVGKAEPKVLCGQGAQRRATARPHQAKKEVLGAARVWNFPQKSQRYLQRVFHPGPLLDRANFHPIPVA